LERGDFFAIKYEPPFPVSVFSRDGDTIIGPDVKLLVWSRTTTSESSERRVREAVTSSYPLLIEDKGSGISLIRDLREEGIHAIWVKSTEINGSPCPLIDAVRNGSLDFWAR